MGKAVSKIYCLFFIIGLVLVAAAQAGAKQASVFSAENVEWTQLEAFSIKQISEGEREFTIGWDKTDAINSCMAFFSSHQSVRVYADGVMVYSVEKSDSVFGRTTGTRWNFVEIPVGTKEVQVDLQAIYPQIRNEEISFLQGNARQIYMTLLQDAMPEVVISFIDMVVGLGMIIYGVLSRRKIELGTGVFFFGLASMAVGLWSFNETTVATLLLSNRVACAYLSYISLMLISIPFILFEKHFLKVKNQLLPDVLCGMHLLNMVVCTALHMTGIREFRETLVATHLLMGAALLYVVGVVVSRIVQCGWDRKVKINIAGAAALIMSFMADMVAYYLGWQKTDVIGKFGLLFFIFLIGMEVVLESSAQMDEGRKAEIYHELAIKDTLTGLYNRNAYDSWQSEQKNCQDILLVTFDLNDLKKCNDTLGHAAGDTYIKTAASMIAEVFGNEGCCYRIGGDEFCAVLNHAHQIDVGQKLENLRQIQREYNKTAEGSRVQIACGYAVFDGTQDKNMEDTRSRADVQMYENKRSLKVAGTAQE